MKKKVIAIIIFVVLGIFAIKYFAFKEDKSIEKNVFIGVKRGPLVINVIESGSIKPQEQLNIKSAVEGRHAIIYLIPEGSHVNKGDLLVELDVSDIDAKRIDQEIVVENAEAAAKINKDNLDIAINQAKADVELAELELRFAREDLEKYKDGEYPKTLSETEGKITLAEEELERAKDKMDWSKRLYDEKYLSETEMRSDELSWKRAQLSLKTAKGDMDLLKKYTYKRNITKLESDVWQKEMALERIKRKSEASVSSAEASYKAKNVELSRQKKKLADYEKHVAAAKIYAPMEGLVIYATSVNRWRNQEPLAEGVEVYERQDLIFLPTTSSYEAEVNIHESNLDKIKEGMTARITIDAMGKTRYSGEVTYVSPLPDSHSMWMNPDLKVYKTKIKIEGGGNVFKSGMNCSAEIIVDQHEDVLYLPIQCVVSVDGKSTVWVKEGKELKERVVKTGQNNSLYIIIEEGLKEGELVCEAPPLTTSIDNTSKTMAKKGSIGDKPVAPPAKESMKAKPIKKDE